MVSEIYIHKSQNYLEKEIAFEQFTLNMSTPVQFIKDWTCLFYIFTMVNSFIISNLESTVLQLRWKQRLAFTH